MLNRSGLRPRWILGVVAIACLGLALFYWFPQVNRRLAWRLDFGLAYLRGVINPVGPMPTALPQPRLSVTHHPTQTPEQPATPQPTAAVTSIPQPSPTPLPNSIVLPAPLWEKQDINNCGPASLAMYLRYYQWEGDQFDVATVLKPQREDRNVNVDELAYYVRNHAGWLHVEYRVGGNLALLKSLLAVGIPVMIEESFYFEEPYWPDDDLWAAHYFLVTGYDDAAQEFTGQDSFYGADRKVAYQKLDSYWQAFNRVYLLVFPPAQEQVVQSLLGEDWDADANRQRTLEHSQQETEQDPQNAFAWFNLGSNLVYFERYLEASQAYDTARNLGLPQRMLRYQFGPFIAYFHTGQIDTLLKLTSYALELTPKSEEAWLWHGWALYRQGKTNQAVADFERALAENPNYLDAQYALNFVQQNR